MLTLLRQFKMLNLPAITKSTNPRPAIRLQYKLYHMQKRTHTHPPTHWHLPHSVYEHEVLRKKDPQLFATTKNPSQPQSHSGEFYIFLSVRKCECKV